MMVRVFAFTVWALVAVTLGFWGLRSFVKPIEAPRSTTVVGETAALRGDLSALFGAPAAAEIEPLATAPLMSARFRLVGVMAPKSGTSTGRVSSGLALIAVDGKPPKPYPVGARIDGDLLVRSVSLRAAVIGPAQGGVPFTLELPLAVAAARGSLAPINPGAPVNWGNAANRINGTFVPAQSAPPQDFASPPETQQPEFEQPPPALQQGEPTGPRAGQVDRGALTR